MRLDHHIHPLHQLLPLCVVRSKLHPQQPGDHHLPFTVAHQQHPLGLIPLGHPLPPWVLAAIVVLVAVMETEVVELPTHTEDEGGVQEGEGEEAGSKL